MEHKAAAERALRALREAVTERNNLERLLDAYEQSIRWHEAARRWRARLAQRPKETEQ